MKILKGAAFAAATAAVLLASTAQAQWGPSWGPGWRGGYGRPGWGGSMLDSPSTSSPSRSRDSREGRVEVTRFVSKDAEAAELGHGPVSVESESGDGPWVAASARRTYEAAIIDALVGAGYDTLHPDTPQPQVTKLRISRQVLTPAEEKRNPVSGTAAMEVGTYGQAYGLGINVDLSKPRSALVSTRLDAQIVDRASGKVLWEGYATIATREGDDKWPDGMIATKLAGALFDNFPKADTIAPDGVGRAG
ncbi:DUF4136 domain-containing protein [Novosphingobium kaempferiae]|uniref:DUF4136 domain-containing protein n=1 Tax=Novosphingobium kaempferiae TaxID=2896849 RepID=UPI001E529740|nr:DUF4136 domain-containing protein [Novosphingobium kaempferiae]